MTDLPFSYGQEPLVAMPLLLVVMPLAPSRALGPGANSDALAPSSKALGY